jgi:amino acid transporter
LCLSAGALLMPVRSTLTSVMPFGCRCGFVAGWTQLLAYLTYASGASALVGNFLQAAAQNLGLDPASLWILCGAAPILAAIYCAYRDICIAAGLMLALEGLSVLAIVVVGRIIVAKVAPATGLPLASFTPSAEFNKWSGIGYALVFTVLSFAGLKAPRHRAKR